MSIHAGALFQFQRIHLKLSGKLSFLFFSCNLAYCHFRPCKHPTKYYLFLGKFHVCLTEVHVAGRTFAYLWNCVVIPCRAILFMPSRFLTWRMWQEHRPVFLCHVSTLGVLLVRCFLRCYRSFSCGYCISYDQIHQWTDYHFYPFSKYNFHTSRLIRIVYQACIQWFQSFWRNFMISEISPTQIHKALEGSRNKIII